jgi:hypothetical protein
MNLLPGSPLAVAPRFHIEPDWPARLALGSGIEEYEGAFFPRGPWRRLTESERALLVAGPPASAPGALPLLDEVSEPPPAAISNPDEILCLFQIPAHLRNEWWELLDVAAATGGPVQGFDRFAARVAEFLAFKRLSAPASLQMEALVTAAGERSIRRAATGRPAGLGPSVAPWTAWPLVGAPESRLWGAVNLGDEDTALVMLNLPLPALAAALAQRSPADPPAMVGELVTRYLRAFPDYPPTRLRLGPGEGCRLPPAGVILDGDPTGKREPDVLLLISASGAGGAVLSASE